MNETNYPEVALTPSHVASVPECILAWLTYLASYLLFRAFPVGEHPLGGFLLILLLYAGTAVLLSVMGKRPQPFTWIMGATAVVLSAVTVISNNGFLNFFAYGYALVTYCYFVYASVRRKGFSVHLLLDYLRALTVLPFHSLRAMLATMLRGKGKGGGKMLLRILIGIALALFPTLIVIALLTYDDGFTTLLDKIFDLRAGDVFSHLLHLVLAIPLGSLAFSVYASAADGLGEDACTEEKMAQLRSRSRILPVLSATTASLPLLFVYVVFFISQWKYYVSGFTGKLPADLSYAEYAREGFFQLCAVSVINFLIILAFALFIKRKDERPPLVLKLLTAVYSLFTLILISTAIAKMVLYINRYGLTQKRVYATWFMLLLTVLFVLVAVSMFVKKLRAVLISALACLVFFAGLALCGPDRLIAEYNVDRYLDGSLETVDVGAMYELGCSSVPAMVRLYENMPTDADRELRIATADYLTEHAYNVKALAVDAKFDLFEFNLPTHRARIALARYRDLKGEVKPE